MVNYPSDLVKSLGYNYLLNIYASRVCSLTDVNFIYNPGLRKLDFDLNNMQIQTVMPGNHNYVQEVEKFITGNGQALVECSGLDAWHTTREGSKYLTSVKAKGYRVVVFDGGHHLATLGLEPDLIMIPQMGGYAVHAYMLDGIKVSTIKKIAGEIHSNSVIVTVPRWALVKNSVSLSGLAGKIFKECYYREKSGENFQPVGRPGMSKYNGIILTYVNSRHSLDQTLENWRLLNLSDVNKIYIAFNYSSISEPKADEFCANMQKSLGIPVQRVNEPVKTFNVLFR
jgi:hypothetical protein